MNARISTKQVLPEEIDLDLDRYSLERKSRDDKSNGRGETFLQFCEDFGLVILNGRCAGDPNGNFTYIGPNGASVIDLCCPSGGALDVIDVFSVGCQDFSDHMPLHVELRGGSASTGGVLPLLPKLSWRDGRKDEYAEKLGALMSEPLDYNAAAQDLVSSMIGGVVRAAEASSMGGMEGPGGREPWWDWSCSRARSRSFSLLKLFRESGSSMVRAAYLSANALYKSVCRRREKEYYDELAAQFSRVRDASDFWGLVRSLRSSTWRRIGDIPMEDWIRHFQAQWSLDRKPNILVHELGGLLRSNEAMDRLFTLGELKMALAKTKDRKAPGLDRVPYEFYKYAPDSLLSGMLNLYNKAYEQGISPSSFSESIIYPLFKKGDINCVTDYRGLSFINCVAKIYCAMLLDRLEMHFETERCLNESQCGFRRGYSTNDAVFTLTSLVHLRLASGPRQKLYALFVDFKAAFDGVRHDFLYQKLNASGVGQRFISAVRSMYSNGTGVVWVKEGISRPFPIECGVRQGCLLSPKLFALYIDGLIEALPCGVRVGSVSIRALMYADDVVILSESPADLRRNIKGLEEYCARWEMTVNLAKSGVMVFRRAHPPGGMSNHPHDIWRMVSEILAGNVGCRGSGTGSPTTGSRCCDEKEGGLTYGLLIGVDWPGGWDPDVTLGHLITR
ncbi:hypothetical protein GE061_012297 [Apolygus lucorum]|uniref:Reverse transcriptase domain-containing protein n=1 Tax=Apolygus lucorum TaxID=248454 RepID=A0A8S9XRV5_APOLU|nr:hypothetical protein GE061_012297 [Apolygus lucorum]